MPDVNEALEAVKQLLDLFKMERMAYLGITMMSLLILLSSATYIVFAQDPSTAAIIGLYGPSGGIVYSTGRLLRMWSEAIALVQQWPNRDNDA